MLLVPAAEKLTGNMANPVAGTPNLLSAAVPTTGAEPRVTAPAINVTVPVGPAPLLVVLIEPVIGIVWLVGTLPGAVVLIVLPALVIATASAAEVLAL